MFLKIYQSKLNNNLLNQIFSLLFCHQLRKISLKNFSFLFFSSKLISFSSLLEEKHPFLQRFHLLSNQINDLFICQLSLKINLFILNLWDQIVKDKLPILLPLFHRNLVILHNLFNHFFYKKGFKSWFSPNSHPQQRKLFSPCIQQENHYISITEMLRWWNWYTCTLEVRMPSGLRVRVPSSAFFSLIQSLK